MTPNNVISLPMENAAEAALLGGLMLDSYRIAEVAIIVDEGDFFRDAHRAIYRVLMDLWAHGQAIDMVTVLGRVHALGLEDAVGGSLYVAGLPDNVPSTENLPYYASMVRTAAIERRVIAAGQAIVAAGRERSRTAEELTAHAAALLAQVQGEARQGGWTTMAAAAMEALVHTRDVHEGKIAAGIPTGFAALDTLLGGLQRKDLMILGARPAMGKTALALNMAVNIARTGVAVGVISLEMSARKIAQRAMASETRYRRPNDTFRAVFASRIRSGQLRYDERTGVDDWSELVLATTALSSLPLYIDDTGGMTRNQIRARVAHLKAQHPDLGVVIIDHLGLVKPERGDSSVRESYAATSWEAGKLLAKDLDVSVVMLAQLNRQVASETGSGRVPQLHHLREAGQIEENADVIGFLHRPAYYAGALAPPEVEHLAEVHIRKNRDGADGQADLSFDKDFVCFLDGPERMQNDNDWRDRD